MRLTNKIEICDDTNELLIHKNGSSETIKIENQLMQLLLLLAIAKGGTIEKRSFIDKIWGGNELTGDAALTKNIFRLREILKNNGIDNDLKIETIPKKGYRLVITERAPAKQKLSRYIFPVVVIAAIGFVMPLLITPTEQAEVNKPGMTTINGADTVIQLGKNKVRVIDLDTARNGVIVLSNNR